jgi:hypothetical protein
VQGLLSNLGVRSATKRQVASDELIRDDSNGKQIRSRVDIAVVMPLLRSHVPRRAHAKTEGNGAFHIDTFGERAHRLAAILGDRHAASDAEVENPKIALGRDHDVFRLEIAVN